MDREIFELLKKENFKKCNEKIAILRKKYPNNSYLRVLEIYAKYRQSPIKFDYEKSLGSIYGSNGTVITSDLAALNLLHSFFFELNKFDESLQVYERANFKYPSFNSALDWFEKSLEDSNFRQLIKASQKMSKLCSEDDEGKLTPRDYSFWYALSILVFFKFQRYQVTEQESKLLPQLAYRTLCSAKPFKSTQEVTVFSMVCLELFPLDAEKSEEVINEIYPHLDNSLDLYLKSFMLKNIQKDDHSTMLNVCIKFLNKIDDYELLMQLIKAEYHMGKPKNEIIDSINSLVGDSRNSRLSYLEIDNTFDGKISESSLLHYLSKYHEKPCCSVDIKRYIKSIFPETLRSVMNSLDNNSVGHDYNAFQLKLTQSDSISLYNKHKNTMKSKSKTDYSMCSKFVLEEVFSLMRHEANSSLEDVLLALSILENYQQLDPHNYDTGVWIIALYMHLGCVPLAYSRFLEFKSKNMQIDTFDYIMYSRYSTLFPSKDHDFLRGLQETQDRLYCSSLDRYAQFIRLALKKGAYSKIPSLIEFREMLEKSSMKWMMSCERLQLARLCNDKRSELLQKLHINIKHLESSESLEFSDNRDWTIFGPEISKDRLPSTLEYLNIQNKAIALNCVKELMIELIPFRESSTELHSFLEKTLAGRDLQDILPECFNEIETWSFNVFFDLYKYDGSSLKKYLMDIDLQQFSAITWKLSHTYLTLMQTLKTLDNFKRIKDPETKRLIRSKINELRNSCDNFYGAYISQLSVAYESLSNNKTLKDLQYKQLNFSSIKSSLLSVQKTVRNL